MTKISLEDAAIIRSAYSEGKTTQYKLADLYNVSVATINLIIKNKTRTGKGFSKEELRLKYELGIESLGYGECSNCFVKFKIKRGGQRFCSRSCLLQSLSLPDPKDYLSTDLMRFVRYIEHNEENDCIDWVGAGADSGDGRGVFSLRSCGILATRFIFQYSTKKIIPSNIDVCHTCDRPPCVNFDHLFLGTRQDNMDDAKKKGRTKFMGYGRFNKYA